jgi:hypothetical protein
MPACRTPGSRLVGWVSSFRRGLRLNLIFAIWIYFPHRNMLSIDNLAEFPNDRSVTREFSRGTIFDSTNADVILMLSVNVCLDSFFSQRRIGPSQFIFSWSMVRVIIRVIL